MQKKKKNNPSEKTSTVLGKETSFKGKLSFRESLRIGGTFNGSVESAGVLTVDAGAHLTADIKVRILIVGGRIQGDVTASERLEILEGGTIEGDIQCPNLVVSEGAEIQGQCEMFSDLGEIDIFSIPPDRLKKKLTRAG